MRKTSRNAPLLHNNVIITNNQAKANILGQVFENNHKLTLDLGDPIFNAQATNDIRLVFDNFNEAITNLNEHNITHVTRDDNEPGFISTDGFKSIDNINKRD